MKALTLLLSVVLAASLSAPALAQPPRAEASVDDIVNALTPAPRTRSLTRNLKVEPAKIDLTIQFDFDSARVKDDSRPQLERLAQALQHERLSAVRFQIEGHTDAKGSAAYNLALSGRRADAVAAFLQQSGVAKDRLQAVGKGYSELLEPADPRAASNRRVRILTLE
jgi:outer membrane protein OmpA-like peptidoglycan-associated protein